MHYLCLKFTLSGLCSLTKKNTEKDLKMGGKVILDCIMDGVMMAEGFVLSFFSPKSDPVIL